MPEYVVRFTTALEVTVNLEAQNEEQANDEAWGRAEEYLQTLGNYRDISASATLDGIGSDEVTEVSR